MRFSERIGVIKAKDIIQLDNMDKELRTGLWNAFQIYFIEVNEVEWMKHSSYKRFYVKLWIDFLKLPLDTLNELIKDNNSKIRDWFFQWGWFEVYDFIEFVSKSESPTDNDAFKAFCNQILERENSGYRFVNNNLAPISDAIEIEEIDNAIEISTSSISLRGVKIHLESALKIVSTKERPDYRNSIKESISAIESLAILISKNDKDSLGIALKKIEGIIKLHPALVKGFKQIYGYTSNADEIRHALLEESNCDYVDA
jgi:hypothetical protein